VGLIRSSGRFIRAQAGQLRRDLGRS